MSTAELATSYAALILADDNVEITVRIKYSPGTIHLLAHCLPAVSSRLRCMANLGIATRSLRKGKLVEEVNWLTAIALL